MRTSWLTGVCTLLCFRRDMNQSQLSRSSSIDSIVEAVSVGWGDKETVSNALQPQRRAPSPLLSRPERPALLVSPSVGRRMKGQRAVSGRCRLLYRNSETQLSCGASDIRSSEGGFRTTRKLHEELRVLNSFLLPVVFMVI
jgi:hypothetical protein